jgi:hypothetical protein
MYSSFRVAGFMFALAIGAASPSDAKPFWQYYQVRTDPICGDYGYGYRFQSPSLPNAPTGPSSVYSINKACRHLLFGLPSYQAQVDSQHSKLIADVIVELFKRGALNLPAEVPWSLPYPECSNAANDLSRQPNCVERFNRLNRSERLLIPFYKNAELLDEFLGSLDTDSSQWVPALELANQAVKGSAGKLALDDVIPMLGLTIQGWQAQSPRVVDVFADWAKGENLSYHLASPSNSPISVDADVNITHVESGGTQAEFTKGTISGRSPTSIAILRFLLGWCQMGKDGAEFKTSMPVHGLALLQEEVKQGVTLRLDGNATTFGLDNLDVKPSNSWLCLGVVNKIEPSGRYSFYWAHSTDAPAKGCRGCF